MAEETKVIRLPRATPEETNAIWSDVFFAQKYGRYNNVYWFDCFDEENSFGEQE